MSGEYVFNLQHVTKQHNLKTVLDDVTLAFFFGAHIGVIGANGSGKSSLLRILAGVDKDFMGECRIARNVRIGYLEQEPQLDPAKSVQEVVNEGVAASQEILDRYDAICDELGSDLSDEEQERLNDELGRLQDIIDANDLWSLDHHVELAMEALRLPPPDAGVAKLSGGERRRVALCRLLISNPDVLLLDEPTNHLDAESVAWIEAYLKKFKGTLVVVTHDRYFLNNVTEWILELDSGRAYPYKGNYESWLEQKQQALLRETRQNESRRKLLENELQWVRTNPSGRRAKSKARLSRYEELARQEISTREDDLRIQIPPGPRLGDLVVKAEKLAMGFGDRLLFEDVSFDLPRGGIVGVIGANGSGKSTLFKLITGDLKPLSGTLTVGPTVVISHVDQMRDARSLDMRTGLVHEGADIIEPLPRRRDARHGRALRRARPSGLRARDHPGRHLRRLDRSRAAEPVPGDAHQAAPAGTGAGAEGPGEDAVPDGVLHLPGAVRRGAGTGGHQHHGIAGLTGARQW